MKQICLPHLLYFGARFIYTQWNDCFSSNFSFSQQRNLNLLSENDSICWNAANPTLKIVPDLKLRNLNRWQSHGFDMSGCNPRTCWRTSSGAFPWTSRKIPWANSHAWPWGQVKNCTLAQLPMFITQKQIPQDPERGTNSPRETSGKFGWIIKINKSFLWEKTVSQGMLYQKSDLVYGKSCSVIGSWSMNGCILIVPWALEHKGTKQIKMPDFTELVI